MSESATTTSPVPAEVRASLALALDVDDLVEATRLARDLQPWFGVAKVGLELYSTVGPDAIGAMLDRGYQVFADIKLHDIPTTVGRAARVFGSLGVSYLTVHAHGGAAMLRAAVEGMHEGAVRAGLDFLAKDQQSDGSWTNDEGGRAYPVAITGLAGTALLANGNTPTRGRYAPQVERAIEYLLSCSTETGLITGPTEENGQPMHGHGFATMFLACVYGMESDPALRDRT